ncbi:MAG: c-type cytochrome [Nitrospinaceae bacterium]|nr:cytochrome c [Nitrospinaceae bacterium]NIS85158.1 cytochrome c [Nitrospinaceae bacterium]NIT81974.1 cytochrome c [Nitrospinaceae bacterium]NIU96358.1 c-type cytochrome [Nitrospinaceae bacterium]NIY15179.1 c-type cytochrome [Nitrospinaceae bacterium]
MKLEIWKPAGTLGLLVGLGFLMTCSSGRDVALEAAGTDASCVQDRKTPRAPATVRTKPNPLPATPETIEAGKALYHKGARPIACKVCHGENGTGRGDPDFASTPPARDFTCAAMMNPLPDGQLFWIIQNGSPNTSMPAFSNLSDEQVWQLVHYLRRFADS